MRAGSSPAGEALVAPVTGVVSAARAVAGQVVDARETVFEVVNPARLRIEALAFDATLAVGQPVRVYVQTRRTQQGMAVPLAALMKKARPTRPSSGSRPSPSESSHAW